MKSKAEFNSRLEWVRAKNEKVKTVKFSWDIKAVWYNFKKKICRTRSFSGVCLNSDALVGKKFGQKSWHRKIEPVWRRKAKIKTRNIWDLLQKNFEVLPSIHFWSVWIRDEQYYRSDIVSHILALFGKYCISWYQGDIAVFIQYLNLSRWLSFFLHF